MTFSSKPLMRVWPFLISWGSKEMTLPGNHQNIAEVVCDMSPAFLAVIGKSFPSANVTGDWFHVVQLFTTAVDELRKAEAKQHKRSKATRWALLKAADGGRLTEKQQQALTELETGGFATATPGGSRRCYVGSGRPPPPGLLSDASPISAVTPSSA